MRLFLLLLLVCNIASPGFAQKEAAISLVNDKIFRQKMHIQAGQKVIIDKIQTGQDYNCVVKGANLQFEISGAEVLEETSYRGSNLKKWKLRATSDQLELKWPDRIEPAEIMLSFFPPPGDISSSTANGFTPVPEADGEYLIKDVLIGGDCFDVGGIDLRSSATSAGTFSMGQDAIGIDEGVVLATGDVGVGVGPNSATNSTGGNTGINSDPDLEQLVLELFNGVPREINDATILEFEFTPTVDSLSFEYVFASEEYCDYVNSEFNDVFGFFISGPGINGPFSNNAENIAVIPGSNDYVSINTVNVGTNGGYYIDNVPIGQNQNATGCTTEPNVPAAAGDLIEYDGFTVPLTAIANVIPCETYTIKLAIADVEDGLFDSAVMLKAGSFKAGGQALLDVESEIGGGSNEFYEACTEGGFYVRRGNTNNLNEPFEVELTIDPSSTATEGEDYAPFDTVIVIPAFSMFQFVELDIFEDDIIEGPENIVIALDNSCSCDQETTEIIILDVPPLESDLQDDTVCIGEPVFFDPSEEVYPGVEYQWSDGQIGPEISVYPIQDTEYFLTVSNVCTEIYDTAEVKVVQTPVATIDVDTVICPEDLKTLDVEITFEGEGPFNFSYNINGQSYLVEGYEDSIYVIPPGQLDTGRYRLNFMDGYLFCPGELEGPGYVRFRKASLDASIENPSCGGQANGRIELDLSGLSPPFDIQWSTGDTTQRLDSLAAGTYSVILDDGASCTLKDTFELVEAAGIDYEFDTLNVPLCNESSGALSLLVDSSDIESVVWSTGDSSLMIDALSPGTYTVEIFTLDGCSLKDSVNLMTGPPLPEIQLDSSRNITCRTLEPEGALWVSAIGQGPISLEWENGDTTAAFFSDESGWFWVQATDSNGCTVMDSFEIPADTIAPEIDLPDTVIFSCDEEFLEIPFELESNRHRAIIINQDTVYQWKGDAVIEISDTGLHGVEVEDTVNQCLTLHRIQVMDPEPPRLQFDLLDTINCRNQAAHLEILSEDAQDYVFSLIRPSGDSVVLDTTFHLLNEIGTYHLWMIDPLSGCSTSEEFSIREDLSRPQVQIPDSFSMVCGQQSVELRANIISADPFHYRWLRGDGEVLEEGSRSSGDSLSYALSQTGNFLLEAVNERTGCMARDSFAIFADRDAPQISIAVGDTLSCVDTIVEIDASGSSRGPNFQWTWSGPSGDIQGSDEVLEVTEAGSYELQITNLLNDCTNRRQISVSQDTFSPPLEWVQVAPIQCSSTEVQFQVEGGAMLQWNWKDENDNLLGTGPDLRLPLPLSDERFFLTATDPGNGCVSEAIITPSFDTLSPVAEIQGDNQLPCNDEDLVLSGEGSRPSNEIEFQWKLGSEDLGVELSQGVAKAGRVLLIVENERNGCLDSTSLDILPPPDIKGSLIPDPISCASSLGGVSIEMETNAWPPYEYRLSNGAVSNQPQFDELPAGAYTVTVTNALDCSWEEGFSLEEPEPLEIELEAELELDYGEQYRIVPLVNRNLSELDTILWTPASNLSCSDCLSPEVTALEEGLYRLLIVDDRSCRAEAEVLVQVDFEPNIYIPNVFTPNSDNINDWFFIQTDEKVRKVTFMEIFDRWGNRMFIAREVLPNVPTAGWNGRFRNRDMDPGVYTYIAEVELVNGEMVILKGDVTLLR